MAALVCVGSAYAEVAPAAELPRAVLHPACIACGSAPEEILGRYSEREWSRLQAGEILTRNHAVAGSKGEGGDSRRRSTEASGIIRRPVERVWEVLVDFESRPDYLPTTKEVRIVRVEGNSAWLSEHLRILWSDIRFVVVNTLEPAEGVIRWVLDPSAPHDIADTRGSWRVVPVSGGRHTLLLYRGHTDTGRPIPGFVEHYLLTRSLPKLVEAMRTEVERRAAARAAEPSAER